MKLFIGIISLAIYASAVPVGQQESGTGSQQSTENQTPISAETKSENEEKSEQFTGGSLIENPTYDPNIYSSLLPQDALQQYVNQYSGPYTHPFSGPPIGYAPAPGYPGAFAIQTGYEGFLVPEVRQPTTISTTPKDPLAFVRALIPKVLFGWLAKSAALIVSTLGVIFFGGAITTAICTLTPLCSISFRSLPMFQWKNTAETVGKIIGDEITPERVRRTAEIVRSAIKKYSELQNYDETNAKD